MIDRMIEVVGKVVLKIDVAVGDLKKLNLAKLYVRVQRLVWLYMSC
jgi:hypothetical protein